MAEVELRSPEDVLVGRAVVDDSVRPFPRAVITPAGGASADELAGAVVRELPGHRLVMHDSGLAEALLALGAELVRASWMMVLALPAEVPAADGVDIGAMDRSPAEYAAVTVQAYGPGHPDHDETVGTVEAATETMRRFFSGDIVGPFLADASGEARDVDGSLLGYCVISDMPSEEGFDGGPWVTDVSVVPAAHGRGIGLALLSHAIHRLGEDGRTTLGLAVTQSNLRAKRLYDELGFVERFPAWTMNLY
jgi:GNAT superfamily N-acetyltransferase